jgi:hypothetical protein
MNLPSGHHTKEIANHGAYRLSARKTFPRRKIRRRLLLGEEEIIPHIELRFVAEKLPPSHVFEQVVLMAAEESGEYFS